MIAIAALLLAASATRELTLEQAVGIALRSNPAMVAAARASDGDAIGLETSKAEFDLRIVPTTTVGRIGSSAFTDASGANSSVGVQMARRFETGTVISLGPSFNRAGADRNTTLSLNLEQPLLRGWDRALTLDAVRRSEFTAASTLRMVEVTRDNVALEVIRGYYDVLRERRLTAFGRAQRDRIERHVRIAESKERAGIIGPMDLYRASIRLKDAEDALNLARLGEQSAMNRLRRALDMPLPPDLPLLDPPDARLPDAAGAEAAALLSSRELLQLRAECDEGRRVADVAGRRILPDVVLRVSAGQGAQIDPFLVQFLPTTRRQWSVSLQSSSDLDRTAERNAWRQAQLRAESLCAALEARINEVRRQVREQQLVLADARARIGLREDQIRQADARLALAEVKFSHDMANNLDVIEAESELQHAEASLAATRTDYAVGVYQLRAMVGQLQDSFR